MARKRDLEAALKKGVQAEQQAAQRRVPKFGKDNRFDKADEALRVGGGGPQNGARRKTASRVIRETFSMLPADFERCGTLQQRSYKTETPANKSELVRAGLWLLENASDKDFAQAIQAVEKVKPGRPALEVVEQDVR